SNTSTPSSALRYQVKITTSVNHSQRKPFLLLFVSESTMPVPDQLIFQVSRTLTLRLAADLDSKSAHHAYHRFIVRL
ncbi:hypothetical protein P692DRAFT_20757270, partial [Suillus brevipes Sb2]